MSITVREQAALNHLQHIVESVVPVEVDAKWCVVIPHAAIDRAKSLIASINLERAANGGNPAPVAMPHYVLRCSAGAVTPVIDVIIHEGDDMAASKVAMTRAKILHRAGYWRYELFAGDDLIARFTAEEAPPTIVTQQWPHGPRP